MGCNPAMQLGLALQHAIDVFGLELRSWTEALPTPGVQLEKEIIMKAILSFKRVALAGVLGAVLAWPVLAQPGPSGPGVQGEASCVTNCGPGMMGGQGKGGSSGPGMRFSQRNTAGWNLMTAEERNAHREKMMAVKSYDECKSVQVAQHSAMEARAKEKGVSLPQPRSNGCDRMKARGMFK